MIQVHIICDTGHSWTTAINGTLSKAIDYFLGRVFTTEAEGGQETPHRVVRIQRLPDVARYQRLVRWAQARYMQHGLLVMSVGGKPTTYARIEAAAFERHMRASRDLTGAIIFDL